MDISREQAMPSKPKDFDNITNANFTTPEWVGVKKVSTSSVSGEFTPIGSKVYYDANTTNKSFREMAKVLKRIGVKNYKFMLTLYNKDLTGIDVYDPFLTDKVKHAIITEIYHNPWYYFREVCRVPIEGGDPAKFRIHIGALSSIFLSLYNMNYYLELPRQTGKTIVEAAYASWLYNFRGKKLEIGMFNYENDKVSANISHTLEILDSIPTWLQFHKVKSGSDGMYKDIGKERGKQMSAKNYVRGTSIKGKTTGTTKNTARNAGRGAGMAKQIWDEIGWCRFNWIAYDSAIYATSASIKNAAKNGMPYGVSMMSTPPDMATEEGKWLHNFVFNEMLKFEPFMFDFDKKTLQKWLNKYAKKDFFYVSYDYRELGFSENWLNERWRHSGTKEAFMRDIKLRWAKDRKGSPFPEHLDPLRAEVELTKAKTVILDGDYLFKTYPGYSNGRHKKVVMGCDVATGGGGDNDASTIVAVDPDTTEVIATFSANNIDTIEFAHVIAMCVKRMFPNSVVAVERNGIGKGVIDSLKRIEFVKRNLYYSPYTDSHDLKKATADTMNGGKKYMYGLIQHQTVRSVMYDEILVKRVQNYKKLFKSLDIVDQIENLVRCERTNRIDHKPKTHDDLVMAYMIALFVLTRDRELHKKFGIMNAHAIPDMSDSEKKLLSEFGIGEVDSEISKSIEDSNKYFEKMDAEMMNPQSIDASQVDALRRQQVKDNLKVSDSVINESQTIAPSEIVNTRSTHTSVANMDSVIATGSFGGSAIGYDDDYYDSGGGYDPYEGY